MFKKFRWPENTDTPLSVQNFLLVDLLWKTISFYTLNGIFCYGSLLLPVPASVFVLWFTYYVSDIF